MLCQKLGEDQKKGFQSAKSDGCCGVLQSANTKRIKGLASVTHNVSAQGLINQPLEKPLAGLKWPASRVLGAPDLNKHYKLL